MRSRDLLVVAVVISACRTAPPTPAEDSRSEGSRFLFVWAGDADKRQSDFLAVIDADPRSATYASVVATVPVGVVGTRPHHTEHEMPASGILWANGFDSSRTFRFDLRDPTRPRLLQPIADPDSFSHPHSYVRLPNGHVLATFQLRTGPAHHQTGGLVEFDAEGRVVRSVNAATPLDSEIRPYSLLILPNIDRVVTTATDMHSETTSPAVQVWRLSDLTLLHTILLPPGPLGSENRMSAEPRVLPDGTVLVNTFHCGLYRLRDVAGNAPSAEWLYSTRWEKPPFCAIPVVTGHFWIQTNGPEHYVTTLDVSDPGRPREVSRLTLRSDEVPHWIAIEPNGDRLLITGYQQLASRVIVAHVDRVSGGLRIDSTFTTPGAARPGIDFARERWPHGSTGPAIPHGAVFSRP